MKCPRCVREVVPGAALCTGCGFSLADLDAHFGSDPVVLDRVHDSWGLFSPLDHQALQQALAAFETEFPQLFFCIHAGPLPANTGPRQFGFWLLNHAAVTSVDITRPNENGALLVLDPHSGQAALTVGYFLECHLSRDDLHHCLASGRRAWQRGKLAAGILAVIREFGVRLRSVARLADPTAENVAVPKPPAGSPPAGLSPINRGPAPEKKPKGERKSPYKKKGKRR